MKNTLLEYFLTGIFLLLKLLERKNTTPRLAIPLGPLLLFLRLYPRSGHKTLHKMVRSDRSEQEKQPAVPRLYKNNHEGKGALFQHVPKEKRDVQSHGTASRSSDETVNDKKRKFCENCVIF